MSDRYTQSSRIRGIISNEELNADPADSAPLDDCRCLRGRQAGICAGIVDPHGRRVGATPGEGQAIGSLFDSKESYLKAPIKETIVAIDAMGRARLTFDGLAAKAYAVSVIYDEDNDGELDTGLLGIPTELIAMSNNAKGRFGPPSFKKARFDLHSSKTIEIRFGKAKD